jgi:metallophosphoesterase superfamily enzyme
MRLVQALRRAVLAAANRRLLVADLHLEKGSFFARHGTDGASL